jgi:ferric-dicitrate binding protein FerR (iron transport regulator)
MNEQQVGKASRIAALIVGNMQDKLTNDEQRELNTWLQENGDNFLLYEELMDEDRLGEALDELHAIDPDLAFERLSQKLFVTEEPAPKRLLPKIWWYMVAATLLLAAGSIVYVAMNKKPHPAPIQVLAHKKQPGLLPDSKKAMLTLANGSTFALNDMSDGSIALQGNITVSKDQNGILHYTLSGEPRLKDAYNVLQTPPGSGYEVILSDGSRIWLNAASTLRFPVDLSTINDRRVTLTGEGYFEIASNLSAATGHKKPFTVSADNMEIRALGTAFNVAAYKEDSSTQTTVVEGLVQVNGHHQQHYLQPGKKLVARDTDITVENADVKQETAWKNNEFVFHNTSLQMVMNELARWYNVKVLYKQPIPSLHFSGEIQREVTINKVLEMLSYTGGVQFDINGQAVTVRSN